MSINILRNAIQTLHTAKARVNEAEACYDAECDKTGGLCDKYAAMSSKHEETKKRFYVLLDEGDLDAAYRVGVVCRDLGIKLDKLNDLAEEQTARQKRFWASFEKAQAAVAVAQREVEQALKEKECTECNGAGETVCEETGIKQWCPECRAINSYHHDDFPNV